MGRHLAANGMTLLIVALVLALSVITWGKNEFSGPGPTTEPVVVEIPRGANLARATRALQEAGVITYPTVFRVGAQYREQDESLKFGVYEVPAAASMGEVLDLLSAGAASSARFRVTFNINQRGLGLRLRDLIDTEAEFETETYEQALGEVNKLNEAGESLDLRVSVSEGLTVGQVVVGLEGIPFLQGEAATIPSEGMLAPDTYSIRNGSEVQALVDEMRTAQESRIQRVWAGREPGLPIETPEEMVALASIIEKETGVPDERGVVAAVFVNRLRQGMRMQTDPTIIYGITRGQEVFDRPIRVSDIRGDTEARLHGSVEYNTYLIEGLPPGPIANPGLASLEAAVAPDVSDYLFFVADGTGGHAFARTLAEHNENVAEYRALQSNN